MAQVEYVIELHRDSARTGYKPYGTVEDFWYCRDHEVMLSGPYETGKTLGALQKIHVLLAKYAGSIALLVRKSYSSLLTSALPTYYNKVLPVPPGPGCPVRVYGGGAPKIIYYPNGSQLRLGGLDYPDKVLSSEYDFIFVPQAEEIDSDDWQTILSRCTGRAGNAPYHQLIGDCNPDTPTHWILHRPTLNVFHTRHEDNPTLYEYEARKDDAGAYRWQLAEDEDGEHVLTAQGKVTMSILDSLTGVRYKRGRLGLWVAAEGQVYEEFNADVHVFDPQKIGWTNGQPPQHWTKFRSIDFGYRHPFVCQWWAEDEDGRLYMYREIYFTERTVYEHVTGESSTWGGIRYHSKNEVYEATVCDWDAEDRATLENLLGDSTLAADKRVSVGIEAVQERLKVQGDARPRIMYSNSALIESDESLKMRYAPTSTVEEFPGYVWRAHQTGKEATSRDERPIKQHDDGMDATRYMVAYRDGGLNRGKAGVVRYA